jgi:hypothetical protein
MIDKKSIPKGAYCYDHLEPTKKGSLKVIGLCPHFKSTKYGAYCRYLKERSYEYDITSLIWDQVKECGVNMGDYI